MHDRAIAKSTVELNVEPSEGLDFCTSFRDPFEGRPRRADPSVTLTSGRQSPSMVNSSLFGFMLAAFALAIGCGDAEEDECESGASACENGVARNCRAVGTAPHRWEEQRCLTGELCIGGNGAPAVCAGCYVDPWRCPPDQTCSVTDTQGHTGCIASGPGQAGAACQGIIGVAECGSGLVCIDLSGSAICRRYCDPIRADRGCPPGESCRAVVLQQLSELPILNVCVTAT